MDRRSMDCGYFALPVRLRKQILLRVSNLMEKAFKEEFGLMEKQEESQ